MAGPIASNVRNVALQEGAGDSKGMSTVLTGFFLAGEMAGSGILALPYAIVTVGWVGYPLLLVCWCGAAFSSIQLGKCWNILEQQWPAEFSGHVRYPYPCIARKAVGFKTRVAVSVCIQITLFGAGVVVLIQCSNLLTALLHQADWGVCKLLPIVAAAVLPILFLGTPKDFWPVGIAALISTSLACFMIIAQLSGATSGAHSAGHASHQQVDPGQEGSVSFHTFSLSFATVLFSFGGASTFPTIQNDMKKKNEFHRSVVICFIILLVLYLSVVLAAYFALGAQGTTDNIILSLKPGWLRTAASVLVSVHLFATCVIVLNPMCQELEEYLRIPSSFTWKRGLFRTGVLTLIVLVGETIPHFGTILNLIGGSTITLCTFVFPSVFYMMLARRCNADALASGGQRLYDVPLHETVAMVELVAVGILGGAAATYTALAGLATQSSFTPPCFVNFTQHG